MKAEIMDGVFEEGDEFVVYKQIEHHAGMMRTRANSRGLWLSEALIVVNGAFACFQKF